MDSYNVRRRKAIFTKSRFRLLALLLVILAAVLAWGYFQDSKTQRITEHPEYFSFSGSYVFAVPAGHIVDELSVPSIQLVYHGPRTAKNLAEAYRGNTISLQPIKDMPNSSSKAFKDYVNEALIPEIKKNVSSDFQLKFSSFDGWDVARITAKKNGQPLRFVYVKNGKHPVVIVAKEESEAFKKIERTITDVETSDLKSDNKSLGQTILNLTKLIKEQKGAELYKQASSELKAKSSEANFAAVLKAAAPYTREEDIVIYGVVYSINPTQYSSVLVLGPSNKEIRATGVLIIDKVDSQWKLKELSLPSPKTPAQ